jgi:2-polyprenyl-6-hydroxyphenyl methylase / 3-demethylubiquinone-9 3-methyltransferase
MPRPAVESVVKAIKRLMATYPMLARDKLLNDTSALMTQHVVHKRPAVEIIDELEASSGVITRQHLQKAKPVTQELRYIMTNADQLELDKFSALAHRWWDPNSEFKPLHEINPLRLDWIDQSGPDRRQAGYRCRLRRRHSGRKHGERGPGNRHRPVRQGAQGRRLHLLESGRRSRATGTSPPKPWPPNSAGQSYDVVTCMEMLEHVPDPASTVHACRQLVKPGGWVFLSTLNRNPKSYLFAIVGAEYILNMLPKGTHDWAKFIKPAELARHPQAGLDMVEVMGMSYNPFTKVYSLGRDTDVNYMIACRKPAA